MEETFFDGVCPGRDKPQVASGERRPCPVGGGLAEAATGPPVPPPLSIRSTRRQSPRGRRPHLHRTRSATPGRVAPHRHSLGPCVRFPFFTLWGRGRMDRSPPPFSCPPVPTLLCPSLNGRSPLGGSTSSSSSPDAVLLRGSVRSCGGVLTWPCAGWALAASTFHEDRPTPSIPPAFPPAQVSDWDPGSG